jgi:hypothetical protein
MSSYEQGHAGLPIPPALDRFAGPIDEADYVAAVTDTLHREGFTAGNTLVAASVCRDELARSLVRRLEDEWGPVFDLSGLAGLPSGGVSALAAAVGHRPRVGDRSRFVLVGMSHVGVDDDGTIGRVRRPGMDRATSNCGSLAGVAAALERSMIRDLADDDLDHEQIRVERRIAELVADRPGGTDLDLADLAEAALRCIEWDLGALAGRLAASSTGTSEPDPARPLGGLDGALLTGIQIHRYEEANLVVPSLSVTDLDGVITTDVLGPRR